MMGQKNQELFLNFDAISSIIGIKWDSRSRYSNRTVTYSDRSIRVSDCSIRISRSGTISAKKFIPHTLVIKHLATITAVVISY